MRASLKENAKSCGRAATLNGVIENLRARYGLTPREARARLVTLKRSHKTSLQEHAAEVDKLVGVAYGEVPEPMRTNLAIEAFSNTLGNAYLQRHLLAVPSQTLEEVVRAGI